MSTALKGVEGIENIEIEVGDEDFTVHFDEKKCDANKIVEALKAGGEKGAAIKS